MPELPDISLYIEALETRLTGVRLERIRINGPFLLRSVTPPIADAEGKTVAGFRRLGKRIAIGLENDLWLVLHLMIAGRLHWKEDTAEIPKGKQLLAAFIFSNGMLTLTEAGSKKRASLHLLQGETALSAHDPGGLEVLSASFEEFDAALRQQNHTLKRVLTDPRLFSGIGNAYSDEILHRARLSPVAMSQKLGNEDAQQLFEAVNSTLLHWIAELRAETGEGFPAKVTAFRKGMAVHGRYGKPCPDCGTAVQRIRYASNETNYCPRCQTDGKVLADRSLSRLLKKDWPKTIDELEQLKTKL